MNREQIYREMEEAFGLVPSFFKLLPDAFLTKFDDLAKSHWRDCFVKSSRCKVRKY